MGAVTLITETFTFLPREGAGKGSTPVLSIDTGSFASEVVCDLDSRTTRTSRVGVLDTIYSKTTIRWTRCHKNNIVDPT